VNESKNQFEEDARLESNAQKRIFSAEEIEYYLISNALMMFFAGFDTTSSGMAFTRCHISTFFCYQNFRNCRILAYLHLTQILMLKIAVSYSSLVFK